MKALAAFAGLEGLFDLAEGNGVYMCATLLRVLTDLYLQRPIHTPEDEHYYTELALRNGRRLPRGSHPIHQPPSPCSSGWRAMSSKSPVRSSSIRGARGRPSSRRPLPKRAAALMPRLPRHDPAVLRKACVWSRLASCRSCSTRQKRPNVD